MVDHRDFAFKGFDEWKRRPEGGRVLDVGCRDEECRARLEEHGYRWEGIDKAPADNTKVMKGNMEHFPASLKERHYNLMFVCHSFEHCERPIDALREFQRLLRKGGGLFLALPEPNEHHILESDDDHLFCLNEMQLRRLLIYTGWENIEVWTSESPWSRGRTYKTIIATGRKTK